MPTATASRRCEAFFSTISIRRSAWIGVGSNSNIAENGMEAEKNRAAILEVDRASGRWRIFASDLRDPNGLTWEPESGALWPVVNERDELIPDLVQFYTSPWRHGTGYVSPGGQIPAATAGLVQAPRGSGTRQAARRNRNCMCDGKLISRRTEGADDFEEYQPCEQCCCRPLQPQLFP
jgi:hypothetical protein